MTDVSDWHEREYNPRVTVAETAELIGAWPARAAATRAAHPPVADIRTGPDPRDLIDLFRPPAPRGAVVYIHGGYFRTFSKVETSFVADGFLGQGLSVALVNYPLCPEVSLEALIDSVRGTFARLWTEILTDDERAGLIVTGHSAGGYMTADLAATDWPARGLPETPFRGAVSLSGVFDLAPLLHTSMNREIRLTADRAPALDLFTARQRVAVPFLAAVGGAESAEFRRQSRRFADTWQAPPPVYMEVGGANHFTILDALSTPGSPLNAAVVALAGGGPAAD